ncbi:19149_t:CDS:2, partial [Cetraspora pellucida]
KLTEADVGSEQIYIYAKLLEVTQTSNEIQKRQLKQQLPNLPKTFKHFSLEEGLRRIQNINTTKISTIQDLADVIMMLSMRPAEVATLSKKLRKIGDKHASTVHDHYNSGIYYVKGNTSNFDLNLDSEPESEVLVPTSKAINENTSKIENIYNLYRTNSLVIVDQLVSESIICLVVSNGTSALAEMLDDNFGFDSQMAVSPLLGQKNLPFYENRT